jgi:hypothetical protein
MKKKIYSSKCSKKILKSIKEILLKIINLKIKNEYSIRIKKKIIFILNKFIQFIYKKKNKIRCYYFHF